MKLGFDMKCAVLLLAGCFALSACDEVVEDSIENSYVDVVSPSDSAHVDSNVLTVVWDELDEATGYRVQVAEPNFDQINALIYDSTTTSTAISFALQPGEYEWRIKGFNGSSESNWLTRKVFIDSTYDLTNQAIVLQYPAAIYYTNETDIEFSWYPLYSADDYSFLIKYDDWAGDLVIPEIRGTETSLLISNLEEGVYYWGVRGESELTNTPYAVRNIIVDRTSPEPPLLISPINSTSVQSNLIFKWSAANNALETLDSLFVYSNAALVNLTYSGGSESDSINVALSAGQYFWRVRTYDEAGNIGEWSPTQSFYVQ